MCRILPVLLAAALAVPACAGRAADGDDRDVTVSSVVPYFAGRTAVFSGGTARTLDQVPRPRLRGISGPVAVGTAGGIVYSTFHEKIRLDPLRTAEEQGVRAGTVLGHPSVRVSGESGDRVLADGAFAPAVSATGRVAVGLLDDPVQRFGREYDAAVAVLDNGAPTRWTDSGGLRTPVAWVGDALLYAVPTQARLPELWTATGPGDSRQLVPAGSFVAASPDRQRVLVAVPEPERDGRLTFTVLSLADGRVLARFATELWWVGLGSWTARQIVAVGAPEPGTLTALALDGDLRLHREVDFDVPAELAAPPNEVSVAPEQKSFGVATFVAGTTTPNPSWVLLSCSLADEACRRADLRQGTEYAGFVSNPST
jgi:hypothetical protein